MDLPLDVRVFESRDGRQFLLLITTHHRSHETGQEHSVSTARGNHLRIQIQRVQKALRHLRDELGVQLVLKQTPKPNQFIGHHLSFSATMAARLSSAAVTTGTCPASTTTTGRAGSSIVPVASRTTATTVPTSLHASPRARGAGHITRAVATRADNQSFRMRNHSGNRLILERWRGLDIDVPGIRSRSVFRTIKLDMNLEESANRFIMVLTFSVCAVTTLNKTLPNAFNCICLRDLSEVHNITHFRTPAAVILHLLSNRLPDNTDGVGSGRSNGDIDDFDSYASHNREGQTLRINNRFNYFHFAIQ